MSEYFNNLKLGSKIGLGFLVFSFIVNFYITLILSLFSQANALNERVVDLRVPTAENSFKLLNGINHSLAALRGWLLMGEENYKREREIAWSKEIDKSLEALNLLSKRWTNPENNVRLKAIVKKLKVLKDYQKKIESLLRTSGRVEANQILIEQAAPTAQVITDLAWNMAMNQQDLLEIDLNESRKISGHGNRLRVINYLIMKESW